MSSLLDILNRRDSRPDPEPLVSGPPAEMVDEAVSPLLELRLAVDNGPPGIQSKVPAHADTGADDTMAGEAPAAAPDPLATVGQPVYGPGFLTAAKLSRRSRRSTGWLGAGLALIIVAAGAATWLLNEISAGSPGDSSLFVTPGADTTSMPVIPEGTVVRPPPVADAVATTTTESEHPDAAWFDTPAAEELSGASDTAMAEPIRIVRGTTTNPLFPRLAEAWTAFQAADYARAETLYREVRAADAANVDALLGLGAIAARGKRTDEARDMYQAALLADPMNATANSALSTLPAAGSRNLDESALKNLLRDQPGAANLHFALGLQYVAQGRWPDAQNAFFEAVKNEPENADYAYNLAVSLDRLRQAGPAAAYYQRALELATASALFNPGAARERLTTLQATAP